MTRFAACALLAALVGCATPRPAWVDSGESIPIRWVESSTLSAEVRDGVCEMRFPDRPDGELPQVVHLARRCLEVGGLRWASQPGAMNVRWHRVDTFAALVERKRQAYGDNPAGLARSTRRPASGIFNAFYYQADACHIVTWRSISFGHELKHCRDGDYHR